MAERLGIYEKIAEKGSHWEGNIEIKAGERITRYPHELGGYADKFKLIEEIMEESIQDGYELDKNGFWKIPRMWEDETCFILGGGPSLQKVNLQVLMGRKVIAVNNAYQLAPFAKICFFGDSDWWYNHQERLMKFPGLRVTCAKEHLGNPHLLVLKRVEPGLGLCLDSSGVAWHTNSGAAAINLAYHLGAAKIVLLGFDGKCTDGKPNWHDEHKRKATDRILKTYVPAFDSLARDLPKRGVDVINCTQDSAITCFPTSTLEEVVGA
jgi:hypothetical protein